MSNHNFIDLKNKKFGKLLVIDIHHKDKRNYYWNCVCDCKNKIVVKGEYLKNGTRKSCGCLLKEIPQNKIINNVVFYNELCASYGYEYKGYFMYKNNTYLRFICEKHKEFGIQKSKANHMKNKHIACSICNGKYQDTNLLKNHPNLNKNIEILGEYIKNNKSILVKCKICNREWYSTPNKLKSGLSCLCNKRSRGEIKIKEILNENKINFIEEYVFDDCVYILPLRFDFYLPDFRCCIEYQGEQHYNPVTFGGSSIKKAKIEFKKRQHRDQCKRDYCKINNIKLIEIPYTDYDNISDYILKIKTHTI